MKVLKSIKVYLNLNDLLHLLLRMDFTNRTRLLVALNSLKRTYLREVKSKRKVERYQ